MLLTAGRTLWLIFKYTDRLYIDVFYTRIHQLKDVVCYHHLRRSIQQRRWYIDTQTVHVCIILKYSQEITNQKLLYAINCREDQFNRSSEEKIISLNDTWLHYIGVFYTQIRQSKAVVCYHQLRRSIQQISREDKFFDEDQFFEWYMIALYWSILYTNSPVKSCCMLSTAGKINSLNDI